jgi:hypothetical protein
MAMIIMMDTVGNRERGPARFAVSEYPCHGGSESVQ